MHNAASTRSKAASVGGLFQINFQFDGLHHFAITDLRDVHCKRPKPADALRRAPPLIAGYDPAQQIPAAWQLLHDRVSLVYDSVPARYFSIFKETADLIVTLIRGGAPVGPSFIPDGSMDIQWG